MDAAFLAARPGLVEALQAARAWGTPPSVFFGGVRRSITRHAYDDVGRLAETWTEHEPLWGDEDREYALALAAYESTLCGGHGGPLAEGMDPAHEFAFVGELAGRCHACTAQELAAVTFEKNPQPSALKFRVTLDPVRAAVGRARVAAAAEEAARAGRGADGAGAAAGAEQGAEAGRAEGPEAGTERGAP